MTPSFADDLAAAARALARRFAAGGTLWCASPAWPSHARHVAVEFVHPVIVGKRALPAVAVPAGMPTVDMLRPSARPGDVLLAIGPADDTDVADAVRRCPAWGVETIWVGAGPAPPPGAADHVLWLDVVDDPLQEAQEIVRSYHLLWELTHVCFEHPAALSPAAPPAAGASGCITCSDEGELGEVESIEGSEAVVRTAGGRKRVDATLVGTTSTGDLVLVHAGMAITVCEPS